MLFQGYERTTSTDAARAVAITAAAYKPASGYEGEEMKILVCGGAGFIGGALVPALVAEGHEVYATLYSKEPRRVDGVKYREVDLTTRNGCDMAVQDCEVVYACAGVTGGSGALAKDPLAFVTPNLLIMANLLRACRDAGVKKVIYPSSTTAYPDTDLPMREEDYFAGEPSGAYFNPGHTRRFIERLTQMYPELNVVCIRPTMIYGPWDDFNLETGHVIPALIRKVVERQDPIVLWGDGSNWRDAVHIDDVVRALVLALKAPPGAYNIATGEGMTVIDILNTLCLHAQHEPKVEFDLSKPAMLKRRVLTIDRAHEILGWTPSVRMGNGLCRTLDWYASQ